MIGIMLKNGGGNFIDHLVTKLMYKVFTHTHRYI